MKEHLDEPKYCYKNLEFTMFVISVLLTNKQTNKINKTVEHDISLTFQGYKPFLSKQIFLMIHYKPYIIRYV